MVWNVLSRGTLKALEYFQLGVSRVNAVVSQVLSSTTSHHSPERLLSFLRERSRFIAIASLASSYTVTGTSVRVGI